MSNSAMSRRDALKWAIAAGGFLLGGRQSAAALLGGFSAEASADVVDHILWAVPELDEGMRIIEKTTGVRPVIGGVHPGRGTRNALISLGHRHYLEILSTDPEQAGIHNERVEAIKALKKPRINGWAAGTRDIASVERRVKQAGLKTSGIVSGSRRKPDGRLLRWKTLAVRSHDGTVVPFVIQWDEGSVHPSEDSPKGCTLRRLGLEHPDAGRMNTFLEALGVDLRAAEAAKPRVTAVLDTPKGRVELH